MLVVVEMALISLLDGARECWFVRWGICFCCESAKQRGKYSRVLPLAQNLALGRVEEGE
jgi:hypothetical protein